MDLNNTKLNLLMPELLKDAIISGYSFDIEGEIIELKLTLYHNVALKLEDIIYYFKNLNFKLVDWNEDEWYDFDEYKMTYITLTTNKIILNNNSKITANIVKSITGLKLKV